MTNVSMLVKFLFTALETLQRLQKQEAPVLPPHVIEGQFKVLK